MYGGGSTYGSESYAGGPAVVIDLSTIERPTVVELFGSYSRFVDLHGSAHGPVDLDGTFFNVVDVDGSVE